MPAIAVPPQNMLNVTAISVWRIDFSGAINIESNIFAAEMALIC